VTKSISIYALYESTIRHYVMNRSLVTMLFMNLPRNLPSSFFLKSSAPRHTHTHTHTHTVNMLIKFPVDRNTFNDTPSIFSFPCRTFSGAYNRGLCDNRGAFHDHLCFQYVYPCVSEVLFMKAPFRCSARRP